MINREREREREEVEKVSEMNNTSLREFEKRVAVLQEEKFVPQRPNHTGLRAKNPKLEIDPREGHATRFTLRSYRESIL